MADIKEIKQSASDDKKGRTQSGTAYPYYNLALSIEVAKAIHEKGGGECSTAHLASFLEYSTTRSGTFVTRLSSAKLFGLVAGKGDALTITDRARLIISPVMPEDATKGKIEAFLEVPLYKALYDNFKGKALPPEVGLKNLFENTYKIVKDRVGPAVRVFYESAEQAGFFELSSDRTQLIPPLMKKGAEKPQESGEEKPGDRDARPPIPERPRGGGDLPPGGGIDPALAGLLRRLPQPGPWDAVKKQQFLDAFKATFDFIYPSENEQ